MPNWAIGKRGDIILRLCGAALALLSFLAIRHLCHLAAAHPGAKPGVLELSLAAVGFLGGSGGAGLLALGNHIFDPVQISQRWAQAPARWELPGEHAVRHGDGEPSRR